MVPSDRARGNEHKLKLKHLGIRKKDFSMRVIKHCRMLPREFIDSMEIINPYGHSTERLALADPALNWEVGLDDI